MHFSALDRLPQHAPFPARCGTSQDAQPDAATHAAVQGPSSTSQQSSQSVHRPPRPAADIALLRRSPAAGLENLGNSCFMNAVLQVLAHLPPFACYCERGGHRAACVKGGCVACRLEDHVCAALRGGRPLAPYALHRMLPELSSNFTRGRQEDAHEYFVMLLDAVERASLYKDLRSPPRLPPPDSGGRQPLSDVGRLFEGSLCSEVRCLSCGHCSLNRQPYTAVPLDIGGVSTLDGALERFTAAEDLNGPNQFRCDRCQRLTDARKRMLLERPAPVLAFHLKRFNGLFGEKLRHSVLFDQRIKGEALARHARPDSLGAPCQYTLVGVVVHRGFTARSGHYVAYVKTQGSEGKVAWYNMDDSCATQVPWREVAACQAYMLFYMRVDLGDCVGSQDPLARGALLPHPIASQTASETRPDSSGRSENGRAPAASQPVRGAAVPAPSCAAPRKFIGPLPPPASSEALRPSKADANRSSAVTAKVLGTQPAPRSSTNGHAHADTTDSYAADRASSHALPAAPTGRSHTVADGGIAATRKANGHSLLPGRTVLSGQGSAPLKRAAEGVPLPSHDHMPNKTARGLWSSHADMSEGVQHQTFSHQNAANGVETVGHARDAGSRQRSDPADAAFSHGNGVPGSKRHREQLPAGGPERVKSVEPVVSAAAAPGRLQPLGSCSDTFVAQKPLLMRTELKPRTLLSQPSGSSAHVGSSVGATGGFTWHMPEHQADGPPAAARSDAAQPTTLGVVSNNAADARSGNDKGVCKPLRPSDERPKARATCVESEIANIQENLLSALRNNSAVSGRIRAILEGVRDQGVQSWATFSEQEQHVSEFRRGFLALEGVKHDVLDVAQGRLRALAKKSRL